MTEIQLPKQVKYFLVPLTLEALMKQRIEEYLSNNPTQQVVVVGIYQTVNEVLTPSNTSLLNAQGKPIAYTFYDGLSKVYKQLTHFCLVADLPTQVSFDYEKLMLENGVIAFDNVKQLNNYLKTAH